MAKRGPSRPLIFAHRGASAIAPENTLAAFRRAAELGADGVELDAQLSGDGEVVVCHDFRVDKTTSASGRVDAYTAGQLRELDAGSWFAPAFAGEYIPTLREVLAELGDVLLWNIELKSDSRKDRGLERKVASLVREFKLEERVILSSFNPICLWRLHRTAPHLPLGLLYYAEQSLPLRRAWTRYLVSFRAMHPYYTMVDARYMAWAGRHGYDVNVWTVDDPQEGRRLAGLGVRTIITNVPDVMRYALEHVNTAGNQGS